MSSSNATISLPPGTTDRKRQIVEVVLRLVAERGVDAVSAQLIADEIGVSQPAVFKHFPTKEAIWLAVMMWLEAELRSILNNSEAANDPIEALRGIFMAHTALLREHPALAKIVFSDQLRLKYPSMTRRFAAIHDSYATRLQNLIAAVTRRGAIEVSVPDAVAIFLALIQGFGFQTAIARAPIDATRLPDQMFRVFSGALNARS